MIPQETVQAVTYANAIDPRVQCNQPTFDVWHRTLQKFTYPQCQAAIQLFYERFADPGNRPVVDAPMVRRIISQETERAGAKGNALTAGPRPVANPLSYRQRNPEEWDRLYEEGRRQGAAEREAATRRRAMAA